MFARMHVSSKDQIGQILSREKPFKIKWFNKISEYTYMLAYMDIEYYEYSSSDTGFFEIPLPTQRWSLGDSTCFLNC